MNIAESVTNLLTDRRMFSNSRALRIFFKSRFEYKYNFTCTKALVNNFDCVLVAS